MGPLESDRYQGSRRQTAVVAAVSQLLLSYGGTAPTRDVPQRRHSLNCSSERTVGGRVSSRYVTSEYLLANYELPVFK